MDNNQNQHLPMDEDDGAQEPPGSALSVHVKHSQDLQEANPSGTQTCSSAQVVDRVARGLMLGVHALPSRLTVQQTWQRLGLWSPQTAR